MNALCNRFLEKVLLLKEAQIAGVLMAVYI
jgi:hypothetical protein